MIEVAEFVDRLYDIMNYADFGDVEILSLRYDLDKMDKIMVHFNDDSRFYLNVVATKDRI